LLEQADRRLGGGWNRGLVEACLLAAVLDRVRVAVRAGDGAGVAVERRVVERRAQLVELGLESSNSVGFTLS